ncbi:MAG: hypothetical protein WC364_05800 [Eubacteriales bacterium]|jgi:hypothetical protein
MAQEVTKILSQEEVLSQLKTRGYEEGFQRTPLRDFWGVLEGYTGEMRSGQNAPYLVVIYTFNSVEVIESTEPYTMPTAQLEIPHSAKAKTKMGYWGDSIDKIINAGVPLDVPQDQAKNQDYLLGKMGRYKLMPGNMIWNTQAREERPVECWKLIELREGTGPIAGTPTTPGAQAESSILLALKLLDGKTEQQWHQEVFVNPIVKADSALVNNIISRQFLKPFELAGTVTKDAKGIYTVKM